MKYGMKTFCEDILVDIKKTISVCTQVIHKWHSLCATGKAEVGSLEWACHMSRL